jgi:hypothetical protein
VVALERFNDHTPQGHVFRRWRFHSAGGWFRR